MQVKALILGADNGIKTQEGTPKILRTVGGIPLIQILMKTLKKAQITDTYLVAIPDIPKIAGFDSTRIIIQQELLGTGHAVKMALKKMTTFEGCLLILFGDTPFIESVTLEQMINKYKNGSDIVVLGFMPADTRRYGRLIVGKNGLERIVEYKEASDNERTIKLCNSGVMCVNGKHIETLINQLSNNNSDEAYYVTQIIELAKKQKLKTDIVIGNDLELHGINTPNELAAAEELYALIKRGKHV